jgi:aspartate/methionine/tyrosine aminotransferase
MASSNKIQLADRVGRLKGEAAFEMLAKALDLEAQGREVIHLEIGEPNFETPKHVLEAGIAALKAGQTHYCPVPGIPELRTAVAEHISNSRNFDVGMEHVVITPGTKAVALFTLLSVIEPGDEVVYFNPGYPLYESLVSFVEATPVEIALHERTGFRPDIEEIARRVSPKTRMLILNSPQNPTGGALPIEDLRVIADLAVEHDFIVLADEIYQGLQYEGEFCSIASLPGMRNRTVIMDGFSKRYAMTGWRLGYGVFPEELVEPVMTLVINSYACVSTFIQLAGIAALQGPQDDVDRMRAAFNSRREIIVEGLKAIPGVHCEKPAGAFYVFPNVSEYGKPSEEIADYLLQEAGVATLPGTGFGSRGEGFLRLSYANSAENIEKGLGWMRDALARL